MADTTSDVLVIGAGIAGLAAATRAAEIGLATVCAEEQMFGGLVLNIAELDPAPAGRSVQGAELSAGLMEAAGVVHCADAVLGLLKGKRIAFVNNGWTSFTKIGGYLTSELKDRYGVANVPMYQIPPSVAPDPKLLDRIAAESDAAVIGLAN